MLSFWPFATPYPEIQVRDIGEEYDYIIVGGGTAGCVLANRLSASPDTSVLLIERGPLADTWASRVPLLSSDFASDGSRTYKRKSEFQPEIDQHIELVVGSALGGSSRINQMLYTRGLKQEYDMWKDAGFEGWGWEDMKRNFIKSERSLMGAEIDEDIHGKNGEWCNQTSEDLHFRGFNKVIDSCKELGLPYIKDINSPKLPTIGCGLLHWTRDQNQHRHSTYHAFLPLDLALKRKKNLHVVTKAVVERIQFESPAIARGVNVVSRSGKESTSVRAKREIILCAGPFGSPHVLMLSGIGPAQHLKDHGIDVIKDLPAVGDNLEDHFGASIAYRVPMGESLLAIEKRPWVFIIELFRYLLFGTGLLLAPVLQLAIFASSLLLNEKGMPSKIEIAGPETLPDVEIMPMAYFSGDGKFDKSRGIFSFLNVLLHPKSKGTVRLSSKDPKAPLLIDPRYLSSPDDFAPLRASLRLTLRVKESMIAQGFPLEDWITPSGEDDASLDKFIRKHNRTTYHYSSTCRMGDVVDEKLRVIGVKGLRVADSSVFPWVLGTHLQAPTVCVAERCAEMILDGK
ncbi:GMC oxidoreductase [Sphaerobolus stellatus SS14]|uniref:GMC oxidoreductase n=1 Tax=Sphaerobolus stellatus (strain SS14) TaxID=990650 RepID=A0A0C9V995_SPHS4|nr:GMC oxidoreductase [Sphaerobolus stellatus SS14]